MYMKKKLKINSEKLRKLIKQKYQGLRGVADRVGCSHKTIERGLYEGIMSEEYVYGIARVLGIRVDAIAEIE